MTFGEKLIFLRKSKNYTQSQIADILDIAKSTYCGYEINNREPDLEKIRKLASFFGVPGNFLLGLGVFQEWEKIYKNKDFIFTLITNLLPELFSQKAKISNISFINILDMLVNKIDFQDDEIAIHLREPKLEKKDNDKQKQQLIDNYEKLNKLYKAKLIDYSNDLILINNYNNYQRHNMPYTIQPDGTIKLYTPSENAQASRSFGDIYKKNTNDDIDEQKLIDAPENDIDM